VTALPDAAASPGRPLWPLVFSALAIMGSPGPATVSLTAAGSAYGVRRSAGYLVGIIAGTTVVLLAVATGITAALLALPALRSVLIAAAAAYLVWLAYRIANAPPLHAEAHASDRAGSDPPSLVGGLLLGIANPKAWVAIAAVYAGAHLAARAAADAVAKVGVLAVMIVLINATWLLLGASIAPWLGNPAHPRRARAVNLGLAAALLAATLLAVIE